MTWVRFRFLALFAVLGLAGAAPAIGATKAVGVIGGFNVSTLKISGQSGLNDRFGVRVEPMYLRNGANATKRNAYWGTMDGADFKLDYLSLPVLARYGFGTNDKRTPYLLGGFGFQFAVKQEVHLTQGNSAETVDLKDVFNSPDITLDLGGGIAFPAGANRWAVDARVAFGLVNVNGGGTITFNGAPLAVPSTSTHSLAGRFFVSYLFNL